MLKTMFAVDVAAKFIPKLLNFDQKSIIQNPVIPMEVAKPEKRANSVKSEGSASRVLVRWSYNNKEYF